MFVTGAKKPPATAGAEEGPAGTSSFETTGAVPGSADGDAIVQQRRGGASWCGGGW